MPEDEGERGERANDRIITLLNKLGWTQQGKENIDIPCTSGVHTDRSQDHGVDSYFTYEDPFRDLERGVFVESKIRQWESINASSMGDYMTQLLGTMECAPEAEKFQSRLNFGVPRNFDCGIISLWSSDEYHHSDFRYYASETNLSRKQRGTYEIMVLGNRDLNKLSRLSKKIDEIRQDIDEKGNFYFYYPSMADKPLPDKTEAIAHESIASDIVFAQKEKARTVDGNVIGYDQETIVFYFGDLTAEALDIVFRALVEYNMLDVSDVHIYYDPDFIERGMQDVETAKTQFKENIVPDKEETPEFDFQQLPTIEYDNYTDRLMGK